MPSLGESPRRAKTATTSAGPTCGNVTRSHRRPLKESESVAPPGVQFQRKELSTLNLWTRYAARRHRKEHERVEAERARQKALAGQDAEEAVREAAQGSAVAQQGGYGQSQP
jgi:hypothetical protein